MPSGCHPLGSEMILGKVTSAEVFDTIVFILLGLFWIPSLLAIMCYVSIAARSFMYQR